MAEYGLAIALDVVIEPDAMANPLQNGGQRGLADFERLAAEIVAVQLNQVESVQEHAGVVSAVTDALEAGYATLVTGDGPPSMMQDPSSAGRGLARTRSLVQRIKTN
jgi:hypothetical protein